MASQIRQHGDRRATSETCARTIPCYSRRWQATHQYAGSRALSARYSPYRVRETSHRNFPDTAALITDAAMSVQVQARRIAALRPGVRG